MILMIKSVCCYQGRIDKNIDYRAKELIILEMILDPQSLGRRDFGGWNLFAYLIFFMIGFALVSKPEFKTFAQRFRYHTLFGAAGIFIGLAVYTISNGDPVFGTTDYSVRMIIRCLHSWLWLTTIWGFGAQHLNFKNNFLKYTSEASLPFYMLHQSVLIVVGYFVLKENIPMLAQYFVIAAISFSAIMVLYEIIRRVNVLRYLFGMKLASKLKLVPTSPPING